jgi:chemotaxis protein CheX
MKATIVPTTEDLEQIAEQVWSSYLDPDGDKPLVLMPPEHPANDIAAMVGLSGAWQGRVVICGSTPMARAATAALLGIGDDEVSSSDILDALGELANIIGGNIKSMLPEPSLLTLPSVHIAAEGGIAVVRGGADEVCRIEATWIGEPVSLSVLEGPSSPGGGNVG